MRAGRRTDVKNGVKRLAFVAIAVFLQILWIMGTFYVLNSRINWGSRLIKLAAVLLVLYIYGKHTNSAYKLAWIMLIMAFPIPGLVLYGMMGRQDANKGMGDRFEKVQKELRPFLIQDPEVKRVLMEKDPGIGAQMKYLEERCGFPFYQNTRVSFFSDARIALEAQKRELRKAEKFIFMEYHAIEEAEAFQGILDILEERAAHGVEVRLFYDDVGSIWFINRDFIQRMEKLGIRCRVFNPVIPLVRIFMNNRDHRKITVIDGKTGFTGGYNLANEYFGITAPYGHWKDSGIMLQGEAVSSLTGAFLEMWNAVSRKDQDDLQYEKYLPGAEGADRTDRDPCGFVQPYTDSPLDDEHTGENVYMNMAGAASKYIYFTTPYLIITDELSRVLRNAVKRGVDVRIITPGIPDKKITYAVTRSYYGALAGDGVRIYEYTPGFIHSKQCVMDDRAAVVGTINMDFRSLYLHFENGVLFYDCPAVMDVKRDFEELFPLCREVTEKYGRNRSTALRIGQCILRLFAPMM